MLAWHCYFDKRSRALVILTGSSWSKIKATVGISEGPFSRWIVDVRISAFQAALIKYGNITSSVVLACLLRLQSIFIFCSFRRRKPSSWAIVFCCGMLGGGRWLVILLTPPTHWLLLKRHYNFNASVTSRRDCWCVLQRVFTWSQFVALLSAKMKIFHKKKQKQGKTEKLPLMSQSAFPIQWKFSEPPKRNSLFSYWALTYKWRYHHLFYKKFGVNNAWYD